MRFGLEQHTIDDIAAILEQYPKIDKAYIFGSRAKGNYRPDSDIDIALTGQEDITYNDLISISVKIDELNIGLSVDLLNYHTIKEPALQEHIDRVGIEFYRRWKEYILTEMGTLQRGKSKHRPRYAFHLYGGPYPFIQTGQIREASKHITKYEQTYSEDGLAQSKLWKKGTLCITIAANIAEVAILGMDACFPDSVLGFIPNKKKCDLDFAFYTLKYFQRELQQMGDGSVQDNINLGTFTQIKFPFPPLPEQTAIASILSSLDDKIDLLHRQNKTLDQLAATLFRQMMSELGNEGLKDDRMTKEKEILQSSNPKNHNSDKGKEAEESWEIVKLEKLGKIICGKTPSKKIADYFNGEIPFIKIPDMHGKTFVFDSEDSLTVKGLNSQQNKTIPPKSICVSCIATVGLVVMNAKTAQTNQQINSIIPAKEIYRYFLYLKMLSMKDDLLAMASGGTATDNLNTGDFSKIDIQVPSKNILNEFHEKVNPLFEKIYTNETQIRTLTQSRETLLPKLMSGEVRVEMQ